jgi:hypothetical protein
MIVIFGGNCINHRKDTNGDGGVSMTSILGSHRYHMLRLHARFIRVPVTTEQSVMIELHLCKLISALEINNARMF